MEILENLKNYENLFFRIQKSGAFRGRAREKSPKNQKKQKKTKNYPDRTDTRTGHPDRYTRGSRVGGRSEAPCITQTGPIPRAPSENM